MISALLLEPKGAFYAFPSIKSTGMTSEEFAENLLMEEKVAVVHGNAFGPSEKARPLLLRYLDAQHRGGADPDGPVRAETPVNLGPAEPHSPDSQGSVGRDNHAPRPRRVRFGDLTPMLRERRWVRVRSTHPMPDSRSRLHEDKLRGMTWYGACRGRSSSAFSFSPRVGQGVERSLGRACFKRP